MRSSTRVLVGGGGVFLLCGLIAAAYWFGYSKGKALGAERGAAVHACRIGRNALWQAVAIRKGSPDRALRLSELQMWNAILPTQHLLEESGNGSKEHDDYRMVLGSIADYFAEYPEPPNTYGRDKAPHESHDRRKRILDSYRGAVVPNRVISPGTNSAAAAREAL